MNLRPSNLAQRNANLMSDNLGVPKMTKWCEIANYDCIECRKPVQPHNYCENPVQSRKNFNKPIQTRKSKNTSQEVRKLKKKRKWITETPIKQRTTDKKNDKVEYSHRQSKAEFFCENLTQAGTNYDVTENQHSVQSESDCEQTDCKNGRNLAQDLFGVRITNQTRKNSHQEAQRITANAKFTAKAKFSETSRNWKRLSKLTVRKTIEKLKRIKENLRDFDTILMDESIRSILEIYPDNSYGFISNEKELENP